MNDKKSNIYYFCQPRQLMKKDALTRRDGRVVECGGLENRCSPSGEPGVRIPLSPQRQITPSAKLGDFYFQIAE